MILRLKDRTEIYISTKEAADIQKLLEDGVTDFIHIGRTSISRSMVAGIFDGGLTAADVPAFDGDNKKLEAGKRCRGQYSIQWQIAMIAQGVTGTQSDDNPKGLKWPKLIKDEGWKEAQRQKLRALQPEGWCDYKAGECACEAGYLSTKARHKPEWVGK